MILYLNKCQRTCLRFFFFFFKKPKNDWKLSLLHVTSRGHNWRVQCSLSLGLIVCTDRISHFEGDTCLAGSLVSQTASLGASLSRPAVLLLLTSAPLLKALTLTILFIGRCEAVLTHQNVKFKELMTESKHN